MTTWGFKDGFLCLTLPGDVPGGYAYTYDERGFIIGETAAESLGDIHYDSGYSFYEEGKLITTRYAMKVENPLFSDDVEGSLYYIRTAGRCRMKKFKICMIMVLVWGFISILGYMIFYPNKPAVSNYRIKAEGKEDGIWCVKVSGMKNKLIQGRLNSLIQKEWMLWLKDYLDKCPSAYEESVGGYIISDRFLCLTNRLDSVVNGIGEPDYYAVYDLKTGKQVYLDDLFELNDDFIYALQQYGKTWQYDTGESMRRISGFEDDSVEEIRDYLERIVMTQTDYNKMFEGTDSESYYKSNYVISGDYLYLRVRIPLDKLEEFLKVPKWWKSKPGLENADLETVNSEIKKYLDMTNQEVRDLTGKDQDRYRDTFVFQTNVLFPCIRPENLPFYFICGDYWDDDAPMYLAFYEKAEEEYMELLGINKDMGFHDIIEVMGTEPVVWDSTEGVSEFDRERYKIEQEKYGLRYVFCSDNAEGYDFSMFIEKTSQYLIGHGLSADWQILDSYWRGWAGILP